MFQNFILNAGVTASEMSKRIAVFCNNLIIRLGVAKLPTNTFWINAPNVPAFRILLTIALAKRATTIAATLTSHACHFGVSVRFVIWNTELCISLFNIAVTVLFVCFFVLCHKQADLLLNCASTVNYTGNFTVAKNHNSVAQFD